MVDWRFDWLGLEVVQAMLEVERAEFLQAGELDHCDMRKGCRIGCYRCGRPRALSR